MSKFIGSEPSFMYECMSATFALVMCETDGTRLRKASDGPGASLFLFSQPSILEIILWKIQN